MTQRNKPLEILVAQGVVLTPAFFDWPRRRMCLAAINEAPDGIRALVLTSFYRPGDPGRHGQQLAVDWDTLVPLSDDAGARWAARVQSSLGWDYDVLYHSVPGRGGPHLHIEDESAKGRSEWTAGQLKRLALLG